MCESSVWMRYSDGQTEKVADDVLYLMQEGDEVVLRWFLTDPRRVRGRIVAVDAVKHMVILEASQPPTSIVKPQDTEAPIEIAHEHPHLHSH